MTDFSGALESGQLQHWEFVVVMRGDEFLGVGDELDVGRGGDVVVWAVRERGARLGDGAIVGERAHVFGSCVR